ncbi:MAG TPA: DUF4352 domain-containing protein [Candidatus Saccharibacteria bacterium]|jgi:hypothetical protein|nr:DUF4352 domain-containing protein [Candidatus Saccharibacteria bacterium]
MKESKKHPQHKLLTIGTIVACLLAITSSAGALVISRNYERIKKENDLLRNGYALKTWQPNELISTDQFQLTVTGVKTDREGIEKYLPVPEGYKFLTVELTVKNMTDSEKWFLPEAHMYMKDASGQRYDLTATKDVQTSIAGPIAAGDTTKGQVGYMVPDNESTYRLYFEPYGEDHAKVAVIDLSSLL